MYQDHLTAPVSLHLLGRPLLPASSHVAAQCYCFQAYTRGQVAPLLLLLIEHRRAAHASVNRPPRSDHHSHLHYQQC
ncbi:hypothetical protein WJX79_007666 [Trebouxia sp. C0005]